jgi:hypothetical protein
MTKLLLVATFAAAVIAPPAVWARAAAQHSLSPSTAAPDAQVAATGTGFPTVGGNQIKVAIDTDTLSEDWAGWTVLAALFCRGRRHAGPEPPRGPSRPLRPWPRDDYHLPVNCSVTAFMGI